MKNLNLMMILAVVLNINLTTQKVGRCYMIPDKDSTVSGEVRFEQESETSPVNIKVKVYGAKQIHGFHVHEKGSIEGGCLSAGGHFNPLNKNHGGPDSDERHMGDLGNLKTTDNNSILYNFTNDKITLFGSNSILGRTCVVHASEDDLGKGGDGESLKTGNSGQRLACGIVQSYNPLYSFLFGLSTLVIGITLSFYYFFCYKNKIKFSDDSMINDVRNT